MTELRLADNARIVSRQPISADMTDPVRKIKTLPNLLEADFSPQ
jgi:hypothetical protein